jgi:hypothetical protein
MTDAIRVRLNALDKDSSASFSKYIEVKSVDDFTKQENDFDKEVPFSRFYFDHEVDHDGSALADEIEALA